MEAAPHRHPFKISVFDATSKLQAGIISGNLYELGHYDQCVNIENAGAGQSVNGKYCLGSAAMLNGTDLLSALLRVAANISRAVSWACFARGSGGKSRERCSFGGQSGKIEELFVMRRTNWKAYFEIKSGTKYILFCTSSGMRKNLNEIKY